MTLRTIRTFSPIVWCHTQTILPTEWSNSRVSHKLHPTSRTIKTTTAIQLCGIFTLLVLQAGTFAVLLHNCTNKTASGQSYRVLVCLYGMVCGCEKQERAMVRSECCNELQIQSLWNITLLFVQRLYFGFHKIIMSYPSAAFTESEHTGLRTDGLQMCAKHKFCE